MTFDASAAGRTFNLRAAADRLGVNIWTLRRCVERGEIGHIRLGSGRGRIFFTDRHLQDYLRERSVESRAARGVA